MTKEQAKSLAIRYHAFLDAMHADDLGGIILWGPMLEKIQKVTGLEMIGPNTINGLVTHAQRRNMKQVA